VSIEYVRRYGMLSNTRAVLSESGYSAILSHAESRRAFDLILDQRQPSAGGARRVIAKAVWQFLRTRPCVERGILLHTSHSGLERERYLLDMRRRGVRPVVLVHDLIPVTHEEYCRPGVKKTHRQRVHFALKHASGILANSQDTLDTLAAEADRQAMKIPMSAVARLASGITSRIETVRPCERPYFVMLGTIEPRKNHWFILHVWRRLVEALGHSAPMLFIIGRRGWECENVVDLLERCEPLREHVVELPDCNDAELHAYLGHAQALLFPSFVEGYGMPLVEALSLGVPVLASDLKVFREIAGITPDYLDPLDGPSWFQKIRSYAAQASAERDAQLMRISQFRAPTWAEHFQNVDRLLDRLA
jgi:glycosyltransferase involved in cell wall biosynthesis